jgi:hypothetical protein
MRLEDNIKIYLTEAETLECVGLIYLVQDTEKFQDLVETAMYVSLPYSAGNVWTS